MKLLKMFCVCGSRSFRRECKPPKQSKSKGTCARRKGKSNPFTSRGIDKFYNLLADHDRKKEKIYMQKGSENIAVVRFVYPDDSDVARPIVVRFNNLKNGSAKPLDSPSESGINTVIVKDLRHAAARGEKKPKWLEEVLKEPRFYLPIMILLIFVVLAIFDRISAVFSPSSGGIRF